ncbi:hypothetical protein C0431_00045 [bacterium]|nr:hypothetical protein [bacterium]
MRGKLGSMFRRNIQEGKWDDGPLVRRALLNDADAWAKIVDRYSGYVMSLLRSTRLPEAEQPDAFQYVFVELFKALPSMQNRDYLAPWIRQTTVRHAIRLRKKLEKFTELTNEEFLVDESHVDEVEASERVLLVNLAVSSLKEQCQKLIRALFFEEEPRSYAEIAEEMGLSSGSMGNTRLRCLEALSKALRSRGVI